MSTSATGPQVILWWDLLFLGVILLGGVAFIIILLLYGKIFTS